MILFEIMDNLLERYFVDEIGKRSVLEHICPGIWFTIHTDPLVSDDDEYLENVIDKLINLVNTFFCEKCRYHLKIFHRDMPIRIYVQDRMRSGYSKGMAIFRWTWLLHNNVNKRLGKDHMPFNLAYNMYSQITNQEMDCSVCRG